MKIPSEAPAKVPTEKPTSVTAREISQVHIPEGLVVVQRNHPELLEAVRVAGGFVLRLRPRKQD